MPMIKVAENQFRLEGDRVEHIPTGAFWSAYSGKPLPHIKHYGLLGGPLDDGTEYDLGEVESAALAVLQSRLRQKS